MSKPVHVDRADCQIRPTTRRKLLAGGAAHVLFKPFPLSEVAQALQLMISGYETRVA